MGHAVDPCVTARGARGASRDKCREAGYPSFLFHSYSDPKMLLVRVDLAGIGFVLGVTEATVLAWLKRAAHQAETINRHLLRVLPVIQVQLDAMWNFIERKH